MNKKNMIFIIIYIFILLSIIMTGHVNAETFELTRYQKADNSANISNGSGVVDIGNLKVTNKLEKVEVSINGKSTTYNYNSDTAYCDLELTPADFEFGKDGKAYKAVTEAKNNYIVKVENDNTVIATEDKANIEAGYVTYEPYAVTDDQKLKVIVTYKIIIENTSGEDIIVQNVKYKCDTRYENININGTTYTPGSAGDININNLNMFISPGSSEELVVTAEAHRRVTYKDVAVEQIDYETIDPTTGATISNTANNVRAKAPTLTVSVMPENRKISGYVWDDSKKVDLDSDGNIDDYAFADGICNETTPKYIKDVIVQLLEVRGNTYYIWQQTKTKDDGTYCFENVIPGDYIVRFIYGYRTSEEALKYNGQDYKSTKDEYYKTEWYNDYYDELENNISVARDNEARRLDVIANTAKITSGIGNALNTKTWPGWDYKNKTYMYADTSKIYIAVASIDGRETTNSNIQVNGMTNGISPNYKSFTNVNFGLEERPKTELTLEKHVEELIVTAGTVEILNTEEELVDNLTTANATRDSSADWKFTMDEEAQASGRIDVMYKYTLENKGETDYISTTLAEKFDELDIDGYSNYLKTEANNVRKAIKENRYYNEIGKYLGSTYYTADDTASDVSKVATHVLEIQDYINNSFTFVETTKTDFVKIEGDTYELKDETPDEIKIKTVVKNRDKIKLIPGSNEDIKIALETEFSAMQDLIYKSYVAQIMEYSNAVGRRDVISIPGNLDEINSLNKKNTGEYEQDEFKAETIEILDI